MVGDPLPDNWTWASIADVAGVGRSVVSGPFGSNIGSRFFVDTGVPVIRGNNLTADMTRFRDEGFVFITDTKASELKNCEAVRDDLIFTAAGSLGQVGLIPTNSRYERNAVILAKRSSYYVLKTAYSGIKPHQRKTFETERATFEKRSPKG